jgi:DNA-binding CsgD family transcriptional regulator/tetratricopeptide (TPR) repeat protein
LGGVKIVMELLEREPFFDEMAAIFDGVACAGGRAVLVSGEAGIGKTSLVEQFTEQRRNEARVLWGACDALFTPRPLGPLHDIAQQTSGALQRLLEAESQRAAIFSAFLDELQSGTQPAIAVIEDVHWADEATLDLLKFLGRRIERIPAMLIVTYRDDEVGADHPLRSVLGDLPRKAVNRLRLRPLSEDSVKLMAERAGRRDENLYAVTGGNPFFVTEALASKGEGVPVTVRDAVLARAARLSPAARAALELVSVVPARAEKWLLEETINGAASSLDECLNAGMLRLEGETLAFRHELARLAIEDSISALRRQSLHKEVLKALSARGPEQVELPRLVHHAAQAGDEAAILQFAPLAARQAAALGGRREAAAHYQTARRYAGKLPAEERAQLFEGRSYECFLTGQIVEAIEARQAALEIWRQLDRRRELGDSLRWMSRLNWFSGRKDEADRYAAEAVAALEELPPGPELAMAYSNLSQLHMLAYESEQAVFWGSRAIELAEKIGAVDTLSHALANIGSAQLLYGDEQGRAKLEESLRLALTHDLQEHAARAYTNLASFLIRGRNYEPGMRYLDEGLAYTTERDLHFWRLHLTAWQARAQFEQGEWASAAEAAGRALGHHRLSAITKAPVLTTLGHLRVRRGDPGAAALLDEALALATRMKELQRLAPVAAARAEAAWRQGDPEQTVAEARYGFELACRHGDSWVVGELGFWMWRAGALAAAGEEMAKPFALQIAGDWRAAAETWEQIGCPYEQALALADGDEEAQRVALEIFERLGAGPAAEALRQKLRAAGVRGLPRGPRPSTKENPLGLTARQMEVLALMAEGLSNAEIANRLFISPKTVDHHISAILAKFDAHSRAEAVAFAQQRGVLKTAK